MKQDSPAWSRETTDSTVAQSNSGLKVGDRIKINNKQGSGYPTVFAVHSKGLGVLLPDGKKVWLENPDGVQTIDYSKLPEYKEKTND